MPRRGECIYKRKDGRWEARYVKEIGADGRKKYASVYAGSYRAVKEKQKQYAMVDCKITVKNANLCISDATLQWLSHIRHSVKLSTYRKYEGLYENHIKSTIGSVALNSVTRSMVEAFSYDLKTGGRKGGGALSAKTVNDILVVLSLVFNFAEEEYDIRLPRIAILRQERKEARVLSTDEHKRLTEYLLVDMDEYKFGVLLALNTGLRIGELCALKWEDITDTYVTVNKTMQRLKGNIGKTEIIIDTPKSDSSKRIIPLPRFLCRFAECFRKNEGYVISTNRSPYCEPRTVQQRFKEITDEIGLEGVTFHTLRHTFATRCIEAGFDAKTLSEILGHSDVKTTLNRYVHSSFVLKQNNMEKLSLLIEV